MRESLYNKEGRHATWLELFFDLIFVVTLGGLIHRFGHTHSNHLDPEFYWKFPLLFTAIWWLWMQHTVFSNRFDDDGPLFRVKSLFVMLLIAIMDGAISRGLEEGYLLFVLLYVSVQLVYIWIYASARQDDSLDSSYIRVQIQIISIGIIFFAGSLLLSEPYRYWIFGFGILVQMFLIYLRLNRQDTKPIDREHFIERLGLFIIILLGESIISMAYSLRELDMTSEVIISTLVGYLMIGAIWWIYFDSFPLLEESRYDKNGYILMMMHVFVCIGFAIIANAISHVILDNLDTDSLRILLYIGLLSFYIGKQMQYFFLVPEYKKYIFINSSVVFVFYLFSFLTDSKFVILVIATLSVFIYIGLNYRAQKKLFGKVYL